MIWLLTRSVVWPVKASVGGVKVGYKTGRLFGYRRVFVFLLGVAVGLLVAPMTGAALRERIRELIEGELTGGSLAEETDGREPVVDLTMEATT